MFYLIILLIWVIGLWKLGWPKDLPIKVCFWTFLMASLIYLIGFRDFAEIWMRISLLSGVIGILLLSTTTKDS